MRRTKIAPTLTAIAGNSFWGLPGKGSTDQADWDRAYRELRALLAVARAADEADILHDGIHDVGNAPKKCAGCRLVRGLRRLRSVSAGKRGASR